MAADYSRIHRLLKILTLIQGSKGWSPKTLAVECSTTERTIYRDMKMLEGAGVPYFYDDDAKCYGVHRDFFMPPVQLTLDESLALAALDMTRRCWKCWRRFIESINRFGVGRM